MKIWETLPVSYCLLFIDIKRLLKEFFFYSEKNLLILGASRVPSNIPPPLPAKPKQSVYAQISGDTSGTYVQPQLIMQPNYRRQQSPTHAASPIKTYGNIEAAGAVKLQYANPRANIVNHSVSTSFEHQKHPSYLSKLVRIETFHFLSQD